jgi:hypothetical protein
MEIQSRCAPSIPMSFITNIYETKKIRWSVVLAEPTRQGANDFESNQADIQISSSQIDAIISLIEESSVP